MNKNIAIIVVGNIESTAVYASIKHLASKDMTVTVEQPFEQPAIPFKITRPLSMMPIELDSAEIYFAKQSNDQWRTTRRSKNSLRGKQNRI